MGKLTVKSDHDPDYENQSSYSITIKGADDEKAAASIDVTVKVRNAEDTGTVSLSARELQINKTVYAELDDDDGGTKDVAWQWYWDTSRTTAGTSLSGITNCSNTNDESLCKINGATSPSYTPTRVAAGNNNTPMFPDGTCHLQGRLCQDEH